MFLNVRSSTMKHCLHQKAALERSLLVIVFRTLTAWRGILHGKCLFRRNRTINSVLLRIVFHSMNSFCRIFQYAETILSVIVKEHRSQMDGLISLTIRWQEYRFNSISSLQNQSFRIEAVSRYSSSKGPRSFSRLPPNTFSKEKANLFSKTYPAKLSCDAK